MVKLLKKAVKWYLKKSAECLYMLTPSCTIPINIFKKAA